MKPKAKVMLGNALDMVGVEDESVDLIVTSPPYFGQRKYFDSEGNEIVEAVGSEASPAEYLDALDQFMAECWRVIKPSGSVFVNLGDKYAGSGGHNNARLQGRTYDKDVETRDAPNKYVKVKDIRAKSLMGLPWRFALSQMNAGWILRQEIIWHKPNGMPESVTDRTKRSHEQWFHFTKKERYFASMDPLRHPTVTEPHAGHGRSSGEWAQPRNDADRVDEVWGNPLGKIPDSVQSVATGGVKPTADDRARYNLPDHFAPFPPEWPRFFILGWCPIGWCDTCGEPIAPITTREISDDFDYNEKEAAVQRKRNQVTGGVDKVTLGMTAYIDRRITGYSCGNPCDGGIEPVPAVVLDPFAGTGTVALVSRILNRSSISLDISDGYIRLINWRLRISNHEEKLRAKWRKKGLL